MAFTSKPWRGNASRFTIGQWRRSCLIDTGQGDPGRKSRYKLPVKEPSGTYNKNGIRNALARVGQVQGGNKAAALSRLKALAKQAGIGQGN